MCLNYNVCDVVFINMFYSLSFLSNTYEKKCFLCGEDPIKFVISLLFFTFHFIIIVVFIFVDSL